MRGALWFLALFGVAVALALFAGNNQGTVTLFWPPYRVDFSLNLVLLVFLATMVLVVFAVRALSAVLALPGLAKNWRIQQRERAMHHALLDGLSHLVAGRFLRARRAAESALAQERVLSLEGDAPPHAKQLTAIVHLLAAEGAQALQERSVRDVHLAAVLSISQHASIVPALREGAQLRAARWALQDQDPKRAMAFLAAMPQGAARRTVALRLKLRAARQSGAVAQALETARLLAKHRGFSPDVGLALVRGLGLELIQATHDTGQLQAVWAALSNAEQATPELVIAAAQKAIQLGDSRNTAKTLLLSVWERYEADLPRLTAQYGAATRVQLVLALDHVLDELDAPWLARLEALVQRQPQAPDLMFLAGAACFKRQLWGKSQQYMEQAVKPVSSGAADLPNPSVLRGAWQTLAQLAERREDMAAAMHAWRQAVQSAGAAGAAGANAISSPP
jgi:HemY protein